MTGDSVYFGDATPQSLAQRAVDMFLTLVRRGTALKVVVVANSPIAVETGLFCMVFSLTIPLQT